MIQELINYILIILCCFIKATRILTLKDIPKPQEYRMKLKGISLCFQILTNIFRSKCVNFEIMKFYGDNCLENSLKCFINLTLSISVKDLMVNFIF